jgi:nucleoside phosphorylase
VRRALGAAGGVRVLTTGMGPEAAARAAGEELGAGVAAVVIAGVAGGCDPGLATGTVVVATALCDLAGRSLDLPGAPSRAVGAALAAVAPSVSGRVASGGGVVDDPAGRARLAAAGVLAVETEAAGWAPACRRAGVPLLVVRAVLDTPDRPLGDAAGLVRPGDTGPAPWRLARLGARPVAWATLARLARTAPAAERAAARAAVAAALTWG